MHVVQPTCRAGRVSTVYKLPPARRGVLETTYPALPAHPKANIKTIKFFTAMKKRIYYVAGIEFRDEQAARKAEAEVLNYYQTHSWNGD